MRQLITFAQRITPRVQECRHARHTVGCRQNHHTHPPQHAQYQDSKIFPRETRQKQHTHRNRHNHDKRAEIRLRHDKNQTQRNHHDRQQDIFKLLQLLPSFLTRFLAERTQESIEQTDKQRFQTQRVHTAQNFLASRKQAGQIQNRRELKQLGRLKIDRPDMNPTRRPVDFTADKQHHHQQNRGKSKIKRNDFPPKTHAQQRQPEAAQYARADKHRLLADKRKLIAAFGRGIGNRRRINHYQAEGGHQNDHPQQ